MPPVEPAPPLPAVTAFPAAVAANVQVTTNWPPDSAPMFMAVGVRVVVYEVSVQNTKFVARDCAQVSADAPLASKVMAIVVDVRATDSGSAPRRSVVEK